MGDRTIAFVMTQPEPPRAPHNDNHLRLPQAFRKAGWEVFEQRHDDLRQDRGPLEINGQPLDRFDWVWILGFGPRDTYAARVARYLAQQNVRWVVPPSAWERLHGKQAWLSFAPPTHLAKTIDELLPMVIAQGGDWVIKPEAGSFGRHVFRANPDNIASLAKQLSDVDGPWLLQRYLPQIVQGETRTLVAGEQVIGSYLRIPADGLTANLAQHAHTAPTTLTSTAQGLVREVHAKLRSHGIQFAAVDTVGDYLMEVNIANPGGLGTLTTLYEEEASDAVVAALS